MRRALRIVCAAAVAAVCASPLIVGQLDAQIVIERVGASPTAPPGVPAILRTAASAVALGLGNVGIVSTDADALFYNVGMLTQARGVSLSVQQFGARESTASLASVQALGSMSFGVGARVLNGRWPVSPFAPASQAQTSDLTLPTTAVALTGAVARTAGPVRVGLGATYLRESFASDFDHSMVFDIGVVYPIGPLNAALTVQHVGEPITLFDRPGADPWRAVLGLGGANFPLSTFVDLSAVSQITIDARGNALPAVGGELAYVPIEGVFLAGRLGVRRPAFSDESAVTAGIGVTLDRYSLDYAFEPFIGRADAHRVGVRIR